MNDFSELSVLALENVMAVEGAAQRQVVTEEHWTNVQVGAELDVLKFVTQSVGNVS